MPDSPDDLDLYYTDSGPDFDGVTPPLILLHGWTCDSLDWIFQLDAFEKRHRVIAIDLRGHGRSPSPASGYSTAQHANDVARVMDKLSIASAVIIGHSLGGCVAAVLAVDRPESVLATVVVEPAYGQSAEGLEFLKNTATKLGNDFAGNALVAELFGATEPHAQPWLRTWHARRALGMPPRILRASFDGIYTDKRQIAGQPATDRFLVQRKSPTLAFHRLPEMARWERTVMSDSHSKIVEWEGSGHWLHQDRPNEFNEIVLHWISSLTDQNHT